MTEVVALALTAYRLADGGGVALTELKYSCGYRERSPPDSPGVGGVAVHRYL